MTNGKEPFVYSRLSLMMMLQYGVWGFWLPVLARYLQATPLEGGLGFTQAQVVALIAFAGSIGAVLAPFIAGQFADRYFSTERFLAILLIAGGVIKWITAYQTEYSMWLFLSIIYSILFMPTLSLTNSLSFAHLDDPDREFPRVRVWGTIGWITASWLFPAVWLLSSVELHHLPPFYTGTEYPDVTHRLVDALKFSGGTSVLYGLYCFFLPHTPPKREAVEKLAFAEAFALFRKSSFALLVLASLPISIIHQIYFIETAPYLANVLGIRDSLLQPILTIGQFAEIVVMALLGFMLKRLGFRLVITIGAMAYFLRFAVFGTTGLPTWFIITSIVLHGFCYACFFAAGFIYVERICPKDARHSAQTVFGIIILGLGPALAGPFVKLIEPFTHTETGLVNYSNLWYSLSAVGLLTGLVFFTFFRDQTQNGIESPAGVAAEGPAG